MTRTVKRFFISSLIFCLMLSAALFGSYLWLMKLTRDAVDPVREYPEWENYISYWKSTWLDLIKRYHDSDNGFCFIGAEKRHRILGLDISVRQLEWCFKNDLITRTETDFLGRVIKYNEQIGLNADADDILYRVIASHNPNGPYSFAYLDNPSFAKHVYERSITAQEVFDTFVELAMKSEYSLDQSRFSINKWDRPVRFEIVDFSHNMQANVKSLTEYIEKYLKQLTDITGLDIQIGKAKLHQGAVITYFYPVENSHLVEKNLLSWIEKTLNQEKNNDLQINETLQNASKNFQFISNVLIKNNLSCVATSNNHYSNQNTKRLNKINWGEIYIPIKADSDNSHLINCIEEELAQILGINNDWRDADPSIFNDYSPYEKLTELDKLLLEILYRPEIKQGMTRFFIQQPLWRIIKELEAKGRLDSIKKRVFRPS